ncbi:glycosyl hydrolase [Novosphingobium sp. TH158]|uniref:glycosyl hydrolase n=1 Tax=Novosphingobium sp. TH158 TaxID=2067455 RepID=UPI000C79B191|nr:glycosyl hydrolase [Novosphingobium sp. TH158]PLK26435.1 glycoside hydrolase [Novosphingobium sp. TH158]
MNHKLATLRLGLIAASALTAVPALAQQAAEPATTAGAAPSLEEAFQNPPSEARPRVWWHWMNGNVTKDGIAKDLAWMKRVGIGGLQNFDAAMQTPQAVAKRLVYMDDGWKDAFRFTADESDRLGLELTIAASPGWSETGGPWVKPEDGLKKLVWAETALAPGKKFKGSLVAPPNVTGPFQALEPGGSIESLLGVGGPKPQKPKYYADVAVLAYPAPVAAALPAPALSAADGKAHDWAKISDGDLASNISLAPLKDGPNSLLLTYPSPVTVRSASLYAPGGSAMFLGALAKPVLETSDDGKTWRKVADIPLMPVPTTISFDAVTASYFRVVLNPAKLALAGMGSSAEGVDAGPYGGLAGGFPVMPVKIGDLRLNAEARVDRFEAKAGFELEPDYHILSKDVPDMAGIAPGSVVNLTGRMKPDGTLDWTPPKLPKGQEWKVLRLGYSLLGTTNHPAPPEATGLEVDKFDGPAVRRYLEHYIGMYREASGGKIGKGGGVDAILTDSIEVGAANWTPAMVDQFRKLRGYDPTPWLPALTGTIIGSRAESDKFLYDYRRTLADLMSSEHYGTVAKVAHENGLKVYGEALENGRPSLGDDMSMRRYADIPMSAMWTHTRTEGPRWAHVADMKGAASVAHIFGQKYVAAESMTSAMQPWDHAPRYLKRIIDLEFVNGVNRPVVHTSVHQPLDDKLPGFTLFIFGQYFNRHESWAELAKPWVDYMSRNSLMLQQGRNVADVGYFYGEDAPLTALYVDKPVPDAPKSYAYDFVNAEALTTVLANDGQEVVSPGGARYRAIYLGGSSHKMTLGTLKKLAALVDGGATVIGQKPQGDPGFGTDAAEYSALTAKLWPGSGDARVGKGRVIASNDIEAAMRSAGVAPDLTFSGAGEGAKLPFVHRKLPDGDSYFIVNQLDRTENVVARFRVTGKAPELFDPVTGKTSAVSYKVVGAETHVPLTLHVDDSVHVVFRKPASAAEAAVAVPQAKAAAALAGPWTVAFQPGRGAPASITMPALAPLEKNADPAVKYFSGIATYSKDFAAPKGWKAGQPLWLDLGEAREVAEVMVNGKSAGYLWRAPYRLDIGKVAKAGTNRLEIKVANLWVNRLIGDAQPGAKKITWTSQGGYRADAPLRPSGLMGPVSLQLEVPGKPEE